MASDIVESFKARLNSFETLTNKFESSDEFAVFVNAVSESDNKKHITVSSGTFRPNFKEAYTSALEEAKIQLTFEDPLIELRCCKRVNATVEGRLEPINVSWLQPDELAKLIERTK